jgi:hypothetical protein
MTVYYLEMYTPWTRVELESGKTSLEKYLEKYLAVLADAGETYSKHLLNVFSGRLLNISESNIPCRDKD